jgi:hypothetical protein
MEIKEMAADRKLAIVQMETGLNCIRVALETLSHRNDWSDDDEVIGCLKDVIEQSLSSFESVRKFVDTAGVGDAFMRAQHEAAA